MKKFAFVAVCLFLTVSAVKPARGVVTGTVGEPPPRKLSCAELAEIYDWGLPEYLFCLFGNL